VYTVITCVYARIPNGHPRETDTDTDILADILARIVARISACRSTCRRNNFRKSRIGRVGEDPREDVRVGVAVGVVEFQLYYASRR